MLTRLKVAIGASAAVLAGTAIAAAVLPNGYTLVSIGDLTQTGLLTILTCVLFVNMRRSHGQARAFWGLMAAGATLWLAATAMWTLYEVIWRVKVPLPFIGDVLFFIHVVPLMAAVGLRPHRTRGEGSSEYAALDFAMLLVWWVYLYLMIVIPWQYVSLDVPVYGFNFSLLYVVETSLLVAMLALVCLRSTGAWCRVYSHLLCASVVYVLGSQMVNAAITRDEYYTGSFYDLPLNLSMCWYIYAALLGGREKLAPSPDGRRRMMPIWIARAAMIAALSIPVIGFVVVILDGAPEEVEDFRVYVTLSALFVLPAFVFLKQHLLDRQLVRLLAASEHNLENLKRLQSQLVQTEKLSALGQLVGGAAHEINNPLTAILGYSDMVENDEAVPSHARKSASKIGEQARRTREIVSNLMRFARQIPGEKTPVDVNSIVKNAIELRELDIDSRISILTDLDPELPQVRGDVNQLLQVFFHVIGNAIDAIKSSGGVITVRSWKQDSNACLEFSDTGPGVQDPKKIFDPFYSTKPVGRGMGLGLSVCYGIVNEHQGLISCCNRPEGGATFTITLPLADAANDEAPRAFAHSSSR